MILARIESTGFRNLEGAAQFGPSINIFYGDNAQGKTNWLEAVYVLGTTKSFRTAQVRDCKRFDAKECLIRGEVRHRSITKQLQLLLTESTKELYVNGKREAVMRYLGNLDVFAFSLEELEVVRGEPRERRRFLDRGVVSLTPAMLSTISQYNHVIKQKNRLLQEASASANPPAFYDQIEAWNEQLVDLGAAIHEARTDYIDRLNLVLDENDHGRAVFGAERITVRYRSQMEGKGDLTDFRRLYRERLGEKLRTEAAAGHSLLGPHRDDLEILADGRELNRFGSAGQQRSALLLLDLAQVAIYNAVYEESPVLLIDDIDAELDRGRIEALVSEIEGRAQTFISTSRRAIASRYADRASVFLVQSGRADSENNTGMEHSQAGQTESADTIERALYEILVDEESKQKAKW